MNDNLWILRLAECGGDSAENALAKLLRLVGLSDLTKPPPKGLSFSAAGIGAWAAAKKVPDEHHEAIRALLAEREAAEGLDEAGGTNNGEWQTYVDDHRAGMNDSAIARKHGVSRQAVAKAIKAAGLR